MENFTSDYLSKNYSDNIPATSCYICGKPLGPDISPDHIIPDMIFHEGDQHRPKLNVHISCNNLKSKEDEWFARHLQIRSGFNPDAEQDLSRMINKAIGEKRNAYIIGECLHNYKLTKTLFENVTWGLELKQGNQSFMQMKLSEKSVFRFQRYVEQMCRGLFIRNVPNSQPPVPELMLKQNAYLELRGKSTVFVDSIKNLIQNTCPNLFGQQWGNSIFYVGSRVSETNDKGYIFVQFYSQFCILAMFR